MQDRIVEVIHPNEAMRTYGLTATFELPEDHGSISSADNMPASIKLLIEDLFDLTFVKQLSMSKGEIRVEVTAAYEEHWDDVSPTLTQMFNSFFFEGDAIVSQRDERPAYERANRHRDDY
jgi:hypothetical protein